jgi:hypothetical protein
MKSTVAADEADSEVWRLVWRLEKRRVKYKGTVVADEAESEV